MKTNSGSDLLPLLARVPLFSDLLPDDLERVSHGAREIDVLKGEILFHKGDRCNGFHLILAGQIKLAFCSSQGDEKVVEILGQGQSFGEAVMFMNRPYIVSAQALSDAKLIYVAKSTIFDEIARDPDFSHRIIAGLAMRLHHLMQDLESYSLCSGKQRVIGYLLRAAPEIGAAQKITVALPTSKANIASRLNLTSEHFSRILNELSTDGLIEVRGRHISIPNIASFRQHAA